MMIRETSKVKVSSLFVSVFWLFFFFFLQDLEGRLEDAWKTVSKGESSSTLNMARLIYLSDNSSSKFVFFFFFNLCKWNKDTFPLNLLSLKKIYFMYFFCLFTASELAKTPRKSVLLNMKNDPKITIDIPQCSKGKILPQLFKESFQELLQIIVYYFFFLV